MVGSEDSACTWLGGHGVCDCTSITTGHALITETSMILAGGGWDAHRHTEALLAVRI